MKNILLPLLLASFINPIFAESTNLDGMSFQSGDILLHGYLYVPSCELSTVTIEGGAVSAGSGGFKLEFTEMSGVRWAKSAPNEILQEELINVVIKNCSLTQLNINLMADNLSTKSTSGNYIELMTYLGDLMAPIGSPTSTWQDEENTASQEWLYYTIGLGDAKIFGDINNEAPLKKSNTDMQCTTSNYCVVKLDGSIYSYGHEWKQSKILDTDDIWQGEWSSTESTIDEIINVAKVGYQPSNLINQSTIMLPMTVRLHHGENDGDKNTIPLGDYESKITITVQID